MAPLGKSLPALDVSLTPEILIFIASFLDAKELSRFGACSKSTRNQTERTWKEISERDIRGTSHAFVDMRQRCDGRQQAILHYRAKQAVRRLANILSSVGRAIPQNGEIDVFLDYPKYYFFLSLHDQPTDAIERKSSLLWEGFVLPVGQGGLEASTILFFHMKELSLTEIKWTPEIKALLEYEHDRDDYDAVENPDFQNLMGRAFDGLVLTLVAFRKGNINAKAELVVSTRGVQFVSRDNRVYFHMTSRQRSTIADQISEETWVYPRLVTNQAKLTGKPGELLGLRLVCQGVL